MTHGTSSDMGRLVSADGWERIYDPEDRRRVVYYNLPGEPRFTISRRDDGWLLKRHTADGDHRILGLCPSLADAKRGAR